MQTTVGKITTQFYDDGIAKGVQILLDDNIICMFDVMNHPAYGGARLIVYASYNEDEPTHIIEINKDKEELNDE